jgi:hypothetical protein
VSRSPARRLAAIAAAAVLVLASEASATIVDFETPPLGTGTSVSGQFADLEFTTGPPGGAPALPRIVDTKLARSPHRTLDISTDPASEFPRPSVAARFTARSRSQVSVWVRNVTSGAATAQLRLQAFNSASLMIAQSAGGRATRVSSSESWKQLAVTTTTAAIAWFRIVSAAEDGGQTILVDDVSFDDPLPASPDFALSSPAIGSLTVLQGASHTTMLSLARLNGSSGNVSLSASGLPAGVTASFAPNPAGGTTGSVALTLRASASAPETPAPVPVTITGTPAGPSVGPAPRSVRMSMLVRRPFAITTDAATDVDLRPCDPVTIPIVLRRAPDMAETVRLSISGDGGAPLPAGIAARFEPATFGPGVETARLVLSRSDAPAVGPVRLRVRASAGSLPPSDLVVDTNRVGPMVTAPRARFAGFAPQGLRPGSSIRVRGRGICAGSRVRFGNVLAEAPLTDVRGVSGGSAGELEGLAIVPRLATDGAVTVVTPGGATGASEPVQIRSFRNTRGFRFANDGWRGGSFEDWQELLGPEQTNFTVNPCAPADCTIVTPAPDPLFALFRAVAAPALRRSDGTCVGFSIGSVRLAAYEFRSRLGLPAAASVWRLDETALVRGRSDIPGRDRPRRIPLEDWLDIQHQTQLTAEFVRTYLARVARYSVAGSDLLRGDLERELAAGRRPMLMMLELPSSGLVTEAEGHAVVAYDVEPSARGFFIRVYDSNVPHDVAENDDATRHRSAEQMSRILVRPDGSWEFPNSGWSGRPGTLTWISAETEIPVQPTSLASLDGITTVIFGHGGAADVSGGVRPFVPLGGERPSPMYLVPGGRGARIATRADRRGVQDVGLFGGDAGARIVADGRPGARGQLTVPDGHPGLGYARAGRSSVDATVMAHLDNGSVRTARIATDRAAGVDELRLDRGRGVLRYRHRGSEATVRLVLSSRHRAVVERFVGAPIHLRAGARIVARPDWSDLGAHSLRVRVGGRRTTIAGRR